MFSDYLVPRYLLQKKYFKFTLYTLYTVIVSINLEILVIVLAFVILANYQYDHMIPATKNVFSLAITMYFIVLIKAFIHLNQELVYKTRRTKYIRRKANQ